MVSLLVVLLQVSSAGRADVPRSTRLVPEEVETRPTTVLPFYASAVATAGAASVTVGGVMLLSGAASLGHLSSVGVLFVGGLTLASLGGLALLASVALYVMQFALVEAPRAASVVGLSGVAAVLVAVGLVVGSGLTPALPILIAAGVLAGGGLVSTISALIFDVTLPPQRVTAVRGPDEAFPAAALLRF